MKLTFNPSEKKRLEIVKNRLLRFKKRALKLTSFKGKYQHGDYLFIKCKQRFGVINHRVCCPNFQYDNVSVVLFGWMITSVNK